MKKHWKDHAKRRKIISTQKREMSKPIWAPASCSILFRDLRAQVRKKHVGLKKKSTRQKSQGTLEESAPATAESLEKIGFDKDDAMKYSTAYEVYQSAKVQAQRADVMDGFGSNGGEEFLSYLQTGESMVIGKDNAWQQWYDNISGRMLKIQNNDGSWNGHHCITSPVFCTATSLLILSINNDIESLTKIGQK